MSSNLREEVEQLEQEAQQLIDKIIEDRKKDHEFMIKFREDLWIKVTSLAEYLEEQLLDSYDHNLKLVQDKLQEFRENIEVIEEIEAELSQICNTVETSAKDLHG